MIQDLPVLRSWDTFLTPKHELSLPHKNSSIYGLHTGKIAFELQGDIPEQCQTPC